MRGGLAEAAALTAAAAAAWSVFPHPWDLDRCWLPVAVVVAAAVDLRPRLTQPGPSSPARLLIAPVVCVALAAAGGFAAAAAAAWAWGACRALSRRLAPKDRRSAAVLAVMVWLSLPWDAPAGGAFSLFLRSTGARFAAAACSLCGIPAASYGARMSVAGRLVDVEPACAGIGALRLFVLYAMWRARRAAPAAVALRSGAAALLAWLSNGLRLALVGVCATYLDPGFVFGRGHDLIGTTALLPGLAVLAFWDGGAP